MHVLREVVEEYSLPLHVAEDLVASAGGARAARSGVMPENQDSTDRKDGSLFPVAQRTNISERCRQHYDKTDRRTRSLL